MPQQRAFLAWPHDPRCFRSQIGAAFPFQLDLECVPECPLLTGKFVPFVDPNTGEESAPLKIYRGGYGAGKTAANAVQANMGLALNPGVMGLVVAQTLRDMEAKLMPDILAHFPPAYPGQANVDKIQPGQWSPIIQRVSLQDNWLRLIPAVGGGGFYWGSADQKKGWEGVSVGWAVGDELRLWPSDTLRIKFVSRVRVECPFPFLAGASTPQQGWFDMWCDEVDAEVFHASLVDNTYRRPGQMERMLSSMSDAEARVKVFGLPGPVTGAVFPDYDQRLNVIDWDLDPVMGVELAVDFGYRRPYCGMIQRPSARRLGLDYATTDGDPVVVFDEVAPRDATTENFARMVLERCKAYGRREKRLAVQLVGGAMDPAGNAANVQTGRRDAQVFLGILRQEYPRLNLQWTHRPELRDKRAGEDAMRTRLKTADGKRSLFLARRLTTNDHRRTLSPGIGLHTALQGAAFPDRGQTDVSEKDKLLEDPLDAVRYYIINRALPRDFLKESGELTTDVRDLWNPAKVMGGRM